MTIPHLEPVSRDMTILHLEPVSRDMTILHLEPVSRDMTIPHLEDKFISSDVPWQQHIWRNFRLELPADWEMLQFTRNPKEGKCAFADRHSFRLELSWRAVPGEPDTERMVSDYASMLAEKGMAGIQPLKMNGWIGIQGTMDGVTTLRFGRFMPINCCIVELVFVFPQGVDQLLVSRMLDGFGELPRGEDCEHWQAFGMEIKAPLNSQLEHCSVKPAMAEMLFADSKHRTLARFTRRGMTSHWKAQSTEAWLKTWAGDSMNLQGNATSTLSRNHEIFRVQGHWRVKGMFSKKKAVLAEAWTCPGDERLYAWMCEKDRLPKDQERILTCCGELGHG